MAETLGSILSYIDEVLPNNINSTTKINFINDEIKEFWPYMTSTKLYEFATSSGTAEYVLPTTNTKIEHIVEYGLTIQTDTNAVTSTTIWGTYSYIGQNEVLEGNRFYDALNNKFGIYPVPDNGYTARIRYREYPTILSSSSDSTTVLNLNNDYIKLIKYKALARVAKTGKFPRVDLANNYEMDAKEVERKLKLEAAKNKSRSPRTRWSYQDWKGTVSSIQVSTST